MVGGPGGASALWGEVERGRERVKAMEREGEERRRGEERKPSIEKLRQAPMVRGRRSDAMLMAGTGYL